MRLNQQSEACPGDVSSLAMAAPCTIRCPQFDLSYGVPGAVDSIIEREGYAIGYIEKHEQPAWVQYNLVAGFQNGGSREST